MCEGPKLTHTSLQTVISTHPSLRASKGKIYMLRDRDEADCLLKQAFEEGVSWPIERSSLNVLADMGLTPSNRSRSISPSIQLRFEQSLDPVGSRLGWTRNFAECA
jgi:hypothetical protein